MIGKILLRSAAAIVTGYMGMSGARGAIDAVTETVEALTAPTVEIANAGFGKVVVTTTTFLGKKTVQTITKGAAKKLGLL